MARPLRIVLAGFGNVGREVIRVLREESERLHAAGLLPVVVGVATRSRGSAYDSAGLSLDSLLASECLSLQGKDALGLIEEADADVVVELTHLNVHTGEPACSHVRAALHSNKHVVLANKGPLAWSHRELIELSEAAGRLLLFESTVMDGTPVFRMARECLRGARVLGIEAVLNSTTNFVLGRLDEGVDFCDAIREAQALGIAEADPGLDIDGWDAAAKIAVLANVLMNADTNPHGVTRTGIRRVTADYLRLARQRGNTVKLIARATSVSGSVQLSVTPEEVPLRSLLGSVSGTSSVLTLHTDLMGTISVVEHEPGLLQTAYGVISDLIEVARYESLHERQ